MRVFCILGLALKTKCTICGVCFERWFTRIPHIITINNRKQGTSRKAGRDVAWGKEKGHLLSFNSQKIALPVFHSWREQLADILWGKLWLLKTNNTSVSWVSYGRTAWRLGFELHLHLISHILPIPRVYPHPFSCSNILALKCSASCSNSHHLL